MVFKHFIVDHFREVLCEILAPRKSLVDILDQGEGLSDAIFRLLPSESVRLFALLLLFQVQLRQTNNAFQHNSRDQGDEFCEEATELVDEDVEMIQERNKSVEAVARQVRFDGLILRALVYGEVDSRKDFVDHDWEFGYFVKSRNELIDDITTREDALLVDGTSSL